MPTIKPTHTHGSTNSVTPTPEVTTAPSETTDTSNQGNFWSDLWDNMTDYYDQSQVGNVASSNLVSNYIHTHYISPAEMFGGQRPDGNSWTNDVEGNNVGDSISQALEGGPSLADYLNEHPNASAEDALKWMSRYSDEWAEKYIDYILEKQSLNEQNAYTASREDTAYQRLVQDLKAAGLNPAMMYGGSASISASGSEGYLRQSEGANSRGISNYSKLKKLIVAYMALQLMSSEFVIGSMETIGKVFSALMA